MDDNYDSWVYAFETIGITLERNEYFLLEGLNSEGVAETILERNNSDVSLVNQMADIKQKYYLQNNSFEFYPGIIDFINSIKKGVKLGIVTGASAERLAKTVPDDFLAKFGSIVSGDKVQDPKPSPEPYILASRDLNISPSSCLVVENAPLGIESAKRAGMDCVAVCSTLDKRYLSGADFIIDDASLLRAFFQSINKE
jgi:HAD superfamily hydrolase (TIGR01509 family)